MVDTEALIDYVEGAIRFARAGEAIVSAVLTLKPVAETLGRIVEIDAELEPELRAALAHVEEAAEALQRASTFIDARFSAVSERLRDVE